MSRITPKQVILDPDEIDRSNRVRVGQFYSRFPHEVDDMPQGDFEDTIHVLWADEQFKRIRRS